MKDIDVFTIMDKLELPPLSNPTFH